MTLTSVGSRTLTLTLTAKGTTQRVNTHPFVQVHNLAALLALDSRFHSGEEQIKRTSLILYRRVPNVHLSLLALRFGDQYCVQKEREGFRTR